MSGHTSTPRFFRPAAPVAGQGGASRAWAGALRSRWAAMRRAAETRRELGALDPRLLADIGVGRAEAEREAGRWPWDLRPARVPGRGAGARG